MAWYLTTPVCVFKISTYRNTFALYADDEFLQTATTPDALADNVFTHTSQFYPWDDSDFDTSDSLSDWEPFK